MCVGLGRVLDGLRRKAHFRYAQVTSRKLKSGVSKSFDSTCGWSCGCAASLSLPIPPAWAPIGPVLVAASEIPNPDELRIKTTVNGIVEQEDDTSRMVLTVVRFHRSCRARTANAGADPPRLHFTGGAHFEAFARSYTREGLSDPHWLANTLETCDGCEPLASPRRRGPRRGRRVWYVKCHHCRIFLCVTD